jgi:hypothetical protein
MSTTDHGAGFGTALLVLALAAGPPPPSVSAEEPHPPAVSAGPRWQSHLVLWPKEDGEGTPWRNDPRLKGRFAEGYPDDVQVLFVNPDGAKSSKSELMWVTIIDYDSESDQFLGILINQPDYLRDVSDRDNVVFRVAPKSEFPVAVNHGQGHRAAALPESKAPEFLQALVTGVRAYRQGNFGHNMPGIELCEKTLSQAVHGIPASASAEEQFAAHFVLARCLAESYETRRAIEEFKAAIAIDPQDRDAQMGLLAELSVMVHWPPDKPVPDDQPVWDKAFLEQLAVVRARFATDKRVQSGTTVIFDEELAGDLSKVTEAELARRRQFGYGVMRWKVR